MLLTVHRGAREVGGNCIEVEAEDARILLDIGAPLELAEGEEAALPRTLKLRRTDSDLRGVVLTHAHQDHYGLWNRLDPGTPCYIGRDSLNIMRASRPFLRDVFIPPNTQAYESYQPFPLGPFSITPYLVDHAAFDAHALLVEAGGRRILYTGDVRAHGRKPGALPRLLKLCPRPVDALIMEGTCIGRAESGVRPVTETGLERTLAGRMKATRGLVLALFASQNIDRFVTFYRAAKRAGRTLVVDAYTAEVIRATGRASLPDPARSDLRVFLPATMKRKLMREGNPRLMGKYRSRRIFLDSGDPERRIAPKAGQLVMVFRWPMRGELARSGCLTGARLIYSMWEGYLDRHLQKLPGWCERNGVEFEVQHTSGHADVATLARIVRSINPARVIPVHTSEPEEFRRRFSRAATIRDGEPFEV